MRFTAIWTTVLAAGVIMGGHQALAYGEVPQRRAALVPTAQPSGGVGPRFDEPTGLWLTSEIDASGDALTQVKSNDFVVRKTLRRGTLTLTIQSGRDALNISISPVQVQIETGKRTLRFDPRRATEQHYHAAKQLLAASRVVGRLRLAAASLAPATVQSAEGGNFLLTEAIVALLDGDPSAVERMKSRARAQRVGTGVQKARATIGMCWEEYSREAYDAMIDAERCVNDFELWNVAMRNLCYLQWTLRSESAWFQLVGCSMGSGIRLS